MSIKVLPHRIVSIISPSRVSGAERYLLFLTKELLALGHNITLISSSRNVFINYMKKELGLCLNGRGNNLKIEVFGGDGKANYLSYKRLKNIIMKCKPDIVHTHLSTASFFGSKIANKLSIPVLSTAHAVGDIWYYKYADKVICVSKAVYEHLRRNGISKSNLVLIRNGIPLVKREPINIPYIKGLWGIPDNNVVIACIGHFSKKKGHKTLFKAFSKLKSKNKTLFLCGEGGLEKGLRKEAVSLGIDRSTIFAGFQDPVENILPIIDIVVLPSLSGEGLPISLIESMFFGLPVIASSISGICELIEDGHNGYLFSPASVDELVEKLSILIDNPSRRKLMGAEGNRRSYSYDIRDNALKVQDLYNSLLQQHCDKALK